MRQGFWLVLALGLAVSGVAALATPGFAGPTVASRYNEIKMSQEQCLKFIGSGPSRQTSDKLSGTLFQNFEGGLH